MHQGVCVRQRTPLTLFRVLYHRAEADVFFSLSVTEDKKSHEKATDRLFKLVFFSPLQIKIFEKKKE